ncbi:mycothiol transferase [Solicola gregarius]|uniref:DinB family protein n=1 Tax=Solicola gregarius TaxID=2908642 RepID=A0AA46TGM2_9ACTN|nr:DinB family protein [Solicola gregarius]UYM04427.1 DinB family protein [Solicola gregarius]
MTVTDTSAVRELLTDSFTRIAELTAAFRGLDDGVATARPAPDANSIAWLLWHLTRIQDDHVAGLSGRTQVLAAGWYERLGLPFAPEDTGFGHTSDQVAQVTVSVDELVAYHADVHAATLAYISELTVDELARVVDSRWDPPVTASARLVSVTGDCLQHLGQAAYVRGLVA